MQCNGIPNKSCVNVSHNTIITKTYEFCDTFLDEFPPWLASCDSALDRRSRPARERGLGRTGEAGQRTGGQEDAPHHANHNRQAASALPSTAAQTSRSMYYQVTRTIVNLIKGV